MTLHSPKARGTAAYIAMILLGVAAVGFLTAAALPWQHRATAGSAGWESGADLPRLAAALAAVAVGLVASADVPRDGWQRAVIAGVLGLSWLSAAIGLAVMLPHLDAALTISAVAAVLTIVGGILTTRSPSPDPVLVPHASASDMNRSVDW